MTSGVVVCGVTVTGSAGPGVSHSGVTQPRGRQGGTGELSAEVSTAYRIRKALFIPLGKLEWKKVLEKLKQTVQYKHFNYYYQFISCKICHKYVISQQRYNHDLKHTHTHIHTRTHTHALMHVHSHTNTHAHIHTCMQASTHTHMHTHVHTLHVRFWWKRQQETVWRRIFLNPEWTLHVRFWRKRHQKRSGVRSF